MVFAKQHLSLGPKKPLLIKKRVYVIRLEGTEIRGYYVRKGYSTLTKKTDCFYVEPHPRFLEFYPIERNPFQREFKNIQSAGSELDYQSEQNILSPKYRNIHF